MSNITEDQFLCKSLSVEFLYLRFGEADELLLELNANVLTMNIMEMIS